MGENLKFSWKMDCFHFVYTRQAKITKLPLFWQKRFFYFLRNYFVGTSETAQNRGNWKSSQILGVTLYLLKIGTFDEISKFYQNYCIILSTYYKT